VGSKAAGTFGSATSSKNADEFRVVALPVDSIAYSKRSLFREDKPETFVAMG
jgi:hypothetical protein